MKNIFVLISSLLFLSAAEGQSLRNDNWYFGTMAAVSFNTGSPVAVATSAMAANEGNATISDPVGNLLFYTNGLNVWASNNVVMPNGTGLLSDVFASQSSLIVPKPGSSTLYYLFTMNTWEFAATDLRYSIIDMTLNGGFGDVTGVKNVLVNNNVREQLTAVHQSNGNGYWILVHEALSQNFLAYELTTGGLNATPVVSNTGMNYTGANRFGCLRFSHHCTKLVSVLGSAYTANETVQIYDFNTASGMVSAPVTLATYSTIPTAYSAEFSPDDTRLYVASYNQSFVYQFDLTASSIASTMVNITGGAPGNKCGLLVGRDGKLYVGMAYTNYLSVINNPNLAGLACGYQNNVLYLGTGMCRIALPNNIQFDCESQVTTSVPELEPSAEWSLFPNPVVNELTVSSGQEAVKEIEIYDVLGVRFYSQQPQLPIINYQLSINISQLPSGIYFVKMSGEKGERVAKFVKQ